MTESLEQIVERCRSMSIAEGVSAWKGKGGAAAVGCFPVYVPEEVLHAAGVLPVGVQGGGGIDTDLADSRVQSFVCSIARSTLELGLRGDLVALDGMLFPNICDVSKNLSGVWHRNFPNQRVEYVHFPQNPDSHHASDYLRAEFERLRTVYSEMSGRVVREKDLRSSIQIFNRNRSLLRDVYQVRCEEPWKLSAAEAYQLVRAGRFMAREDHSALLQDALAAAESSGRRRRDGLRVVVEGAFCEQPPVELLETLEQAGCFIVDDDLQLGRRWFECDVAGGGDPLAGLARGYLKHSTSSSIRHGGDLSRAESLVAKVKRVRAQGVLFCAAKFCEPALFDYPLLRGALEREGIPYMTFEFEEKMSVFESVRSQAETFVEASLFFS